PPRPAPAEAAPSAVSVRQGLAPMPGSAPPQPAMLGGIQVPGDAAPSERWSLRCSGLPSPLLFRQAVASELPSLAASARFPPSSGPDSWPLPPSLGRAPPGLSPSGCDSLRPWLSLATAPPGSRLNRGAACPAPPLARPVAAVVLSSPPGQPSS